MSKDWLDDLNDISGITPSNLPDSPSDIDIGSILITEGEEIGSILTEYNKEDADNGDE